MPVDRQQPQQLDFGPLPVDLINRVLEHDLEEGHTVFSANAQSHAARRHPVDYGRCLPHVAQIIADPQYMRDDFKNEDSIELVRHVVALGEHMLVAVEIARDAQGHFNVKSFYPIGRKKLENRLAKGGMKRVNK